MTRCSKLRERAVTLRKLLLISLVLIGFATCNSAEATTQQSSPLYPHLSSDRSVVFADLDGDTHPDSAKVWNTSASSATGRYWLELSLSSTGRQSIPLVGPAGGLVIEARDVNGDHAIDLILATAWFKQPVAVFLNDGHGSFFRAETAKFPGAFASRNMTLTDGSSLGGHALAIPVQYRGGLFAATKCLLAARPPTRILRDRYSSKSPEFFLSSSSGRAPPSRLIHS